MYLNQQRRVDLLILAAVLPSIISLTALLKAFLGGAWYDRNAHRSAT
jgi:hypothetical protein